MWSLIEVLGDRGEADATPIKQSHQSRKIQQGPAQPSYFIDHHPIDFVRFDISQQSVYRLPLQTGAAEAPVVISASQSTCPPAFGSGCQASADPLCLQRN